MNPRYSNCYDFYFICYGFDLLANQIDWLWFKAQAIAESSLNPEAVSQAGAMGVMQLMPATGTAMARQLGITFEPKQPHTNIRLGILYDKHCWSMWQAEHGIERIRFMLGSYNAGPGNIAKAQKLAIGRALPADKWQSMLMAMEKCTSFGRTKVYHPCNGVGPEGATLAS